MPSSATKNPRGTGPPRAPHADAGHGQEIGEGHADDAAGSAAEGSPLGPGGSIRPVGPVPVPWRPARAGLRRTRSRSASVSVIQSKVRAYARGTIRTGRSPMLVGEDCRAPGQAEPQGGVGVRGQDEHGGEATGEDEPDGGRKGMASRPTPRPGPEAPRTMTATRRQRDAEDEGPGRPRRRAAFTEGGAVGRRNGERGDGRDGQGYNRRAGVAAIRISGTVRSPAGWRAHPPRRPW